MASLGCTVLERITSDISRFRGMSSLQAVSTVLSSSQDASRGAYKLDEVARSICSSSALFVDDPNQPAMVVLRLAGGGASGAPRSGGKAVSKGQQRRGECESDTAA
tara:strand:+ start:21268 stop:21585 length:318 start_codon:yes stop_codon:yes gene_type:complete